MDESQFREFATLPSEGEYACQDKAWMDEVRMHEWVAKVLKPWKNHRDANYPSAEPPLLILDAYHVHQMGSVVNRIQMMGIEVLHIPAVVPISANPSMWELINPSSVGCAGNGRTVW